MSVTSAIATVTGNGLVGASTIPWAIGTGFVKVGTGFLSVAAWMRETGEEYRKLAAAAPANNEKKSEEEPAVENTMGTTMTMVSDDNEEQSDIKMATGLAATLV